jgi:hypothetical protein
MHKNKTCIKTYFLIINLVISILAFSVLIEGQQNFTVSGTPVSTNGAEENTPDCPTCKSESNTPIVAGGRPPVLGPDTTGVPVTPEGGKTGDTDGPTDGQPVPPQIRDLGGGEGGGGGGRRSLLDSLKNINLENLVKKAGLGATVFGAIGALAGGDKGAQWGAISGAIGGVVSAISENMGLSKGKSLLLGLGVAAIIFIITYKKASTEIVEYYCLPWKAPIGGGDCELCNQFEDCSEYSCKSLGQACEIINQGTEEQRCVWQNPRDVNSPTIEMVEVSDGHEFTPDQSVRPPATGVVITRGTGECIKAFTPLEFTFVTDEPAHCKVDYNLTTGFDEMSYDVGGSSLFRYNHTEKLSLPGPDALNAVAPELQNDGEYTLYVRCSDANGNFNQDAYSVNFCVEKGPDATPPIIVDVSVPSGNPIQFNQTELGLEVYVNEPVECKWSREDRTYDNMENEMTCLNNIWEMNARNVYTCRTTLTGIQDRTENKYYFKCKDQPWAAEGDRNTNVQSYLYRVIGTQPLNILSVAPNRTIIGATNVIPVFLEVVTDNGYKDGEATCYYAGSEPDKEEDYVAFLETGGNKHKQRQDLVTGDYTYYIKCVDLGGNAVYTTTKFRVESDRESPFVARVYKESGELKIITSEKAECSYSAQDCNFEIEDGIKMSTQDFESHNALWILNQKYHIRCKDDFNNEPNPNTCSIIVRATKLDIKEEFIEL